jgi:hypothetical protein
MCNTRYDCCCCCCSKSVSRCHLDQGSILYSYQAIFLLSGDAELTEVGETTKILYHEYHDYYHQTILSGSAWSRQVLAFFDNALFSGTSSYAPPADALDDDGQGNIWEENFERAMEQGLEGPLVIDDDGGAWQIANIVDSCLTCQRATFRIP